MPVIVTKGFVSFDAGQGNGTQTVSTSFEISDDLLNDVKSGVPFDYFGAARNTELPGLINATSFTGRYVPADTSNQLYLDMIASYDDSTECTMVVRNTSAAKSSTNHEITIKGRLAESPLSGISHGGDIHYPVNMMISQVTHDDNTTTYTW